jgi:hypothetical protein
MTIVMSSSLAGAEMMTFLAPPSMCCCASAALVKRPVDSMTMSMPRSFQGSLAGSRSASTLIDWPPTRMTSSATETSTGSRPNTLSYFSRWARVAGSVRSLAATISISPAGMRPALPMVSAFTARQKLRPMRPKPLMPTRMVTAPSPR